ncbi:MAG: ZIP family metal transporter [Solirubrobacteraceae bacterium]
MLPFVLALAAVGPRVLGGISVLRGRERLHLAMGFAGGALLGVALLDTGPEAVDLLPGGLLLAIPVALLGVAAFAALERTVFGHVHVEDAACNPVAGHISAAGISIHAFLDGVAIGTAFQVSAQVGAAVSVAVLLHAFSDGMNTVTAALRHGLEQVGALRWLAVNAIAPLAGAALGLLVGLPGAVIGALLAFFAGMFVYLGAGSLLPEAHRTGRDREIVWLAALAGAGLALAGVVLAS